MTRRRRVKRIVRMIGRHYTHPAIAYARGYNVKLSELTPEARLVLVTVVLTVSERARSQRIGLQRTRESAASSARGRCTA